MAAVVTPLPWARCKEETHYGTTYLLCVLV
jgi:hypothetical protein